MRYTTYVCSNCGMERSHNPSAVTRHSKTCKPKDINPMKYRLYSLPTYRTLCESDNLYEVTATLGDHIRGEANQGDGEDDTLCVQSLRHRGEEPYWHTLTTVKISHAD